MMNAQQSEFSQRIARIERGEGSFKSMVFVGNDQTYHPDDLRRAVAKTAAVVTTKVTPRTRMRPRRRGFAALSIPLSFLIGASGFIAWRVVDFHLHGLASLSVDPIQMMAVNGATGMAIAIMVCQTLMLTAPQHILAAFFGLVAMGVGFPDLVTLAPDQFSDLFSPVWVGTLLAESAPMSAVVGTTT
jgi:hypothetical protein